jgi:hypothetical protein
MSYRLFLKIHETYKHVRQPESLGVWTLDFVRRPEFLILGNTMFRTMYLFPSSGEGRETPSVLGPLDRANLNQWKTHVKFAA